MPSLRLVCQQHGWRCVYCDGQAESVDHVIPRRAARKKQRPEWLASISAPENLMPACHACNTAKGKRDVRDFLRHDPARLARIVRAMVSINPGAAAILPPHGGDGGRDG